MLIPHLLFTLLSPSLATASSLFANLSTPSTSSTTALSSIRLILHNNCAFPIWARQAIAANPSPRLWEKCANGQVETREVEVEAGGTFFTPFTAGMDSCGHSVKFARTPGSYEIYQFESNWARENGRIWYNLST